MQNRNHSCAGFQRAASCAFRLALHGAGLVLIGTGTTLTGTGRVFKVCGKSLRIFAAAHKCPHPTDAPIAPGKAAPQPAA